MPSIGILITVWKRNYLEEQLEHLLQQDLLPDKIWILQNETHLDFSGLLASFRSRFPPIFTIRSEQNLKFFGRFSLATQLDTDYLFVIDDDVIPGRRWLSNCLQLSLQHSCIVASSGRIIQPGNFKPEFIPPHLARHYFVGDCYNDDEANFCPQTTLVDYGCNSYFLKAEWLRHFWSLWPCTFLSGEDIHLSATCKISKQIPTYVPQQTNAENCGNLKKYYSQDSFSAWRKDDFLDIREKVFRYLITEKSWKPILWQAPAEETVVII